MKLCTLPDMVLQSNDDYHYNQSGSGVIDCMYGGEPYDSPQTCGLWDGIAPAYFTANNDYGSRHYPLIYHSKIYIKIIYVNSFN